MQTRSTSTSLADRPHYVGLIAARDAIDLELDRRQKWLALSPRGASFDPQLEDIEIRRLEIDVSIMASAATFNCFAPDVEELRELWESELITARAVFTGCESDLPTIPRLVDGRACSVLAVVEATIARREALELRRLAREEASRRIQLVRGLISDAAEMLNPARKAAQLPFVAGVLAPPGDVGSPNVPDLIADTAAVDRALDRVRAARVPQDAPLGVEQIANQIYVRRKALADFRQHEAETEARHEIIASDPFAFQKEGIGGPNSSISDRAKARVAERKTA